MNEGARGLFPWEEDQDGDDPAEMQAAPGDVVSSSTTPDPATPDVPTSAGRPDAQPAGGGPAPDRARRPDGGQRPLVRKEYYSISEVADIVGLPAHVLRYWESQFSVLSPSKNRSGNRVYQRKEIRLILLVKQLLHDEKYTVEGAKQKLDQLRRAGGVGQASQRALEEQLVQGLREDLLELRQLLRADTA